VTHAGLVLAWADAKTEPLLTRLTPDTRARVVMALIALVIVGLALMALAALGGRFVLRQARKSLGPTPRREDDWYRKPLIPRDPPSRMRDSE